MWWRDPKNNGSFKAGKLPSIISAAFYGLKQVPGPAQFPEEGRRFYILMVNMAGIYRNGRNHWLLYLQAISAPYTDRCCCLVTNLCLSLFATPWTVARQAPLSMGFSRQEYWSGLPFPSPGIFPIQGSNLQFLHWQAESLQLSHLGSPHIQITDAKWNILLENGSN